MITRSGTGVGVASLVALSIGWRFEYLELVVLGAVGVLAVVLALINAARGQRLEIRRRMKSLRVTRGDELSVRYSVRNISARRQPACTLVDECAGEQVRIELPSSPGKHSREWVGSITMRRRGVHTVGPIVTEQTDVLGLASGRKVYDERGEVWVQPRPRQLQASRGVTRLADDEARAARRLGDPLSGFHSLRPYVMGDDTRLIHWPSTAKTGDLMVREFVDSRRPQFSVVLDTDRTVGTPDDFEEAVDVAASLAVAALRDGLDVVLRTTQRAHAGRAQRLLADTEALDLLTRVEQSSGPELVSLAGLFTGGFPDGVLLVVTGPEGPSGNVGLARSDVRVIRIGRNASVSPSRGVAVASENADMFAHVWSGLA
jgi:uncharacterized protein (DUF58 family)